MIVYLDNSATTKPCARAIEYMNRSLTDGYFNPSSLYAPAIRVERELNHARERIRSLLNAPPDAEVLFTSGGTEANNLAILGTVQAMRGPRHLITSGAEHPSVLEPFEALGPRGHRLSLIPIQMSGEPDWDALEAALRQEPSLISLMHVNNETGAMLDVERLSKLVRALAPGCLIHVDGVQGFLHQPIDFRLIDLYTLSGHKIHAPKGVGALVMKKDVRLAPRQLGGGQQRALRSGTENTPGILALAGAMEYMAAIPDLNERLMRAKLRLYEGLQSSIDGLLVNGPAPGEGAPHIINLSFPGVRGEVLLHALEAEGIYCSTGSACSSKKRKLSSVLLSMGIHPERAEGSLRFSFSPDTTDAEIDYATKKIAALHAQFKRYRRK